ncbi:MAG TPA: hypothetical protein VHL58_18680 [Thermoanaerobaculia bacterium]|nr:hypothetical protein [Thermoanaerobaculia bacterium]
MRYQVKPFATLLFGGALILGASIASAATSPGALQLVPGDAVAVGYVRLDQLRTSPLSGRIFHDTDNITVHGDGEEFLKETGLQPSKDIDAVVFALRASDSPNGDVLLGLEGRFDVQKLSAASASHDGKRVDTASGAYYRFPHGENDGQQGAVAFLNKRLVILGTERAVLSALTAYSKGGSGFATSTLGREMRRVDRDVSAWALVDVPRMSNMKGPAMKVGSSTTSPVIAALGRMTTVAIWTKDTGDALQVGGVALTNDVDTRDLVADAARGVLAAWRLALQDKAPEVIPVLRQFKITTDNEGVKFSGTVPASAIDSLRAHKSVAAR